MDWWGSGFVTIILYATMAGAGNSPANDAFLLLDGTNFLLLDLSDLLLLG